jgi:hypothetical protein
MLSEESSSLGWLMILVIFVIQVLLSSTILWLAMKVTRVGGSFLALVVASAIAEGVAFIPYAGTPLSLIVLILLIWRLTAADLWPDTILIVIVSWLLTLLAGMLLLGLFD